MKKMDISSKNNLKKLIDDADAAIVVTNKACGIVGNTRIVCSMLTMIVRQLKFECNIPQEMIKQAFRLGTLSEKELLNEAKDILGKENNEFKEVIDALNKLNELIDKL